MLAPFKNRLGIPGLIAALALVFALSGGALAAKDNLSAKAGTSAKKKGKKNRKANKRGRRGLRGKRGLAGAQGPIGFQGPIGPAGPSGADGADGAAGSDGTPGQGVTSEEFGPGEEEANCPAGEGGSKFVSASGITYACNGKIGEDGEQGAEGSPWTELGTLPSGETVTGAWGATIGKIAFFERGFGVVPISFTIPLESALPPANIEVKPVGYDGEDEVGVEHEQCPGKAANPRAKEGFLCVYTLADAAAVEPGFTAKTSASRAGVVIRFLSKSEGQYIEGTWAVTAP